MKVVFEFAFTDSSITDARFYCMFLVGESQKESSSGAKEKIVQETVREVEKNPDVLLIIEAQNPSLAYAIERISPKLKAQLKNVKKAQRDSSCKQLRDI